ncbi:MAG TPA: hypothetical protein VIA61_18340 [Methylomirabilota bacterium]
MRRIRTIVLLETLLIAITMSPAQAVPVPGPHRSFDEVVPTPVASLGSSDLPSEGTWTDGLAVNPVFWIGGPGRSAPGGVYPRWALGQPDTSGVQSFLSRGAGDWNDFAGVQGQHVRYSAPEPGTFALFGVALAGAGLAGWLQQRRARALGRVEP